MPVRRKLEDGGEEDEYTFDGSMPRKRAHGITEIERRLESLIVRVGEKNHSTLESNIEGLAGVLEADIETYKARIIDIIIRCVLTMPEKLTVYSTLIGILNSKNYEFGGEFIEALLKKLRDLMKTDQYDEGALIVTLVCDLVNCRTVSGHSCMTFLQSLADNALQSFGGVPQCRTDWQIYCIVSSLPWIGLELSQKRRTELDHLVNTVDSYLSKRNQLHVPMLSVWSHDKPHVQEDYLVCLWKQIEQLSAADWREGHIARYYVPFDHLLADALQHNLPTFIPPAHSPNNKYPVPRVVFRMFDQTDVPEEGPAMPGVHSIERFLIERDLHFIINRKFFERKDCAADLLKYPKAAEIPLNYMILEVVFGELFQLPNPNHIQLFYGSLLIELCKLQPNSMPQVLAQAAEMFYQRVDTMHCACFDRLVNWFSYHLSNFQFRWSWDDWTDCLPMDALHPRQMFVREVLAKCMRFSYHQRVADVCPPSFAALLPAKPEAHFKYTQAGCEQLAGHELAQTLAQAIKTKVSCEDVVKMVEEQEDKAVAIDAFVLTLLHLGSKSFSHSFAALAKYHGALKQLTEGNEDNQLAVLRAVYELWSSHPQMLCVLFDKLLKMQIVECACVVTLVFSEQVKPVFLRMWVWELLESALVKLSRHVRRLQMQLEDDQADVTDMDSASNEVRSHLEDLQQQVEAAENVHKNLLLTVFQKLTILLTEHLLQSEAEGKDFNTHYYTWVIGRLRQIFLIEHEDVAHHASTLETFLFTADIDPHILEVFHQFCALKR